VPTQHPLTIVFVCRHNSGRSQMAAAYLKEILGPDIVVASGGPEPCYEVEVNVKRAMAEEGVFIERARPRPLDAETIERADCVVAVGCDVPVGPRLPRIDAAWDVEDTEGRDLDEVRRIRDGVKRRVLGIVGAIRRSEFGALPNMLIADELFPKN
jgi:arsenate reductase